MIRTSRAGATVLGLILLAWQVVNASRGRFVHPFLIADLMVAVLLLISSSLPNDRTGSAVMLAAFSATAGVFLAATTAAILRDGYSLGRVMTGVGLVPCVIFAVALGKSLGRA